MDRGCCAATRARRKALQQAKAPPPVPWLTGRPWHGFCASRVGTCRGRQGRSAQTGSTSRSNKRTCLCQLPVRPTYAAPTALLQKAAAAAAVATPAALQNQCSSSSRCTAPTAALPGSAAAAPAQGTYHPACTNNAMLLVAQLWQPGMHLSIPDQCRPLPCCSSSCGSSGAGSSSSRPGSAKHLHGTRRNSSSIHM